MKLKVFDMFGRKVTTLVNGGLSTDEHSVLFDASGLLSGTYIYVLQSGGSRLSKKMLLVK